MHACEGRPRLHICPVSTVCIATSTKVAPRQPRRHPALHRINAATMDFVAAHIAATRDIAATHCLITDHCTGLITAL